MMQEWYKASDEALAALADCGYVERIRVLRCSYGALPVKDQDGKFAILYVAQ